MRWMRCYTREECWRVGKNLTQPPHMQPAAPKINRLCDMCVDMPSKTTRTHASAKYSTRQRGVPRRALIVNAVDELEGALGFETSDLRQLGVIIELRQTVQIGAT